MKSKRDASGPKGGEKETTQAIHELTERNIQSITESEAEADKHRAKKDIIAEAITRFCGTATFLWVHMLWFGIWMVANVILPSHLRWDPSPFGVLTLVVSLEAIFLSTFILISENREAQLAQRREHLDLQINLLAEQENTKMLELLEQIAEKLGVATEPDRDRKAMKEAADPDRMLKQIDKSLEEQEQKKGSKK